MNYNNSSVVRLELDVASAFESIKRAKWFGSRSQKSLEQRSRRAQQTDLIFRVDPLLSLPQEQGL